MDTTELARGARQMLESLQRAGVTHLPRLSESDPRWENSLKTHVGEGEAREDEAREREAREREAREGEAPAEPLARGSEGASPSQGARLGRSRAPGSGVVAHRVAGSSPVSSVPAKSLVDEIEGERFSHGPKQSTEQKLQQLQVLQNEVAACLRCNELAGTRTQTVFGVGSPNPRLVFLGEAPGADEDAKGEPFVGRAGQLLTDMITKGMKLRREDVYILNVLKCRPPGNRNPNPNEIINCKGFLEKQLEILQPEFICCLGSIAARTLLNTEQSIGRLRKKWHEYRGIPVICTYHPAYLLRNPAAKRDVWEDLQLLMQRMGLPV